MPNQLSPEDAASALLVAAPTLKQILGPHECVRHTRLAVDLCRHWGVRARPLPVAVEIQAPVAPAPLRLGFKGDPVEDDGEEQIWDGHLVTLIDRRVALDLTIDSMARPEWGLQPEPFMVEVPSEFDRIEVDLAGGTAVYLATPDRTDYRTTPSWSTRPSEEEIADMAMIFENMLAKKEGRPTPWK